MCVDWRGVVVVVVVVVVGVMNNDYDVDDDGATMMTSSCHIDEAHSKLPNSDHGHSLDPSIARYSDIHCCDSGYWCCCSHC